MAIQNFSETAKMIDASSTHDVLEAMRGQEEGAYSFPIKILVKAIAAHHEGCDDNVDGAKTIPSRGMVDYITWRRQMATWCIEIADMLNYQIETVEVALSILDRATAADSSIVEDPGIYQLACVSSLYIAAKMHEKEQLSVSAMAHLCLSQFTTTAIEEMERHLLFAIRWRVNPPTTISFARCLLRIANLHEKHREIMIMEEVKKQLKKALVEDYFLTVKASTLAFAAVMNGLQQVKSKKPMYYYERFQKALGYNESVPSMFIDVVSRLHLPMTAVTYLQ